MVTPRTTVLMLVCRTETMEVGTVAPAIRVAAIAMVAMRLKNFKEAEVRVNSLLARPDVMSPQSGIGKMPPVNSSLAGGRSVSPWMQPPETYRDVRDIARAIQRKLDSEKPAADETSAAPVKDARADDSAIKPVG